MKQKTEIHLVVPGICGPVADLNGLHQIPEIKEWVSTLSKAKCLASKCTSDEVLCNIAGLQYDNHFPSAALTLLSIDGRKNSRKNYMFADPVHLQADLDHAILTSSVDLAISESESSDLCDVLNQHFEQDGLFFERISKDEWLVASSNKIEMSTTPLMQAIGRNVNFLLPKGKGADYWKKILTEAQMIMYSSDVNKVRENKGQQSINSLWFHGSGDMSELKKTGNEVKVNSICSDDDVLKGLAKHISSDYTRIPASVDRYIEYVLSQQSGSVNIFHQSELEHLINYTDINVWLEKLADLLDNWIYPLLSSASNNNIKVILYPCDNKQYQFSKYDSLKFWRKADLTNIISSY